MASRATRPRRSPDRDRAGLEVAQLNDNPTANTFGSCVALNGGTALVGDYRQTVGTQKENGAAYVYSLGPTASPVDSTSPGLAGTPAVGQTLTCSTGTWAGTPAPTFTYQWLRNGQPISGATDAAYLVQAGDLGRKLACQVMASNTVAQSWTTSDALAVPAPTVTLKASSLSLRVGKSVTLSGSVKHALAVGRTVSIYRKVSTKLILLKRVSFSSAGSFKTVIGLKKTGSWVLLASYGVSGRAFKSKTVTVKVHS